MYTLGIDLGTTYTAAAVHRDGRAEIASLGSRTAAIPSVVLLREDASVIVGEAAHRRALTEPDRVAREFKRRFGDSTPIILGGTPLSPEALTARLLAAVVAEVTTREGGPPSAICLCHPANWGPFKTDLLRQAVRLADLTMPVTLTSEPEAAAVFYAREQRIAAGDVIAVYDLGGGTFDAAVLRRTRNGFEILGRPEGIERLGGIDVDAAVFSHVARALGDRLTDLDEDDAAAVAAVARLRQECIDAKEALSADTDVTIPVILPGYSTEVRLTREELEGLVRPALYDSIAALQRAMASAGVGAAELHSVLLVGGSSRMPLVAQLVGAELGRPVAVDAHPKHAVALGAAYLASGATVPAPVTPPSRLYPAPATTTTTTTTGAGTTPTGGISSPEVRPADGAVAANPIPHPSSGPLRPTAGPDAPTLIHPGPGPAAAPGSAGSGHLSRPGSPAVRATLLPTGSELGGTGSGSLPASPPRQRPARRRAGALVLTAAAGAILLVAGVVTAWAAGRPDNAGRTAAPGLTGSPTGTGAATGTSAPSTGSGASGAVVGGGATTASTGTGTVHLVLSQPGTGSGGSVLVQPGGHRCSRECTLTFQLPATVTLTGQAKPGYRFTPWSGSTCFDVTPCTLRMPRLGTALEVRAGFTKGLLVSVTVQGSGSVSSDDGKISCPGTCAHTYPAGTQVLLHPGDLSTFSGWTGCTDHVSGGGCGVSGVSTGTVHLVASFGSPPSATASPSATSSP